MKDLRGSASTPVHATSEESIALLAAVDRYPTWYPEVIREVDVLERGEDGVPRRAMTTVHLSLGPLAKNFRFQVAVDVRPPLVVISRLPNDRSDPEQLEVRWHVQPGSLGVEVEARLSVPRLAPVGGAGDSVAQRFADAARRALDGSSPNASASSS